MSSVSVGHPYGVIERLFVVAGDGVNDLLPLHSQLPFRGRHAFARQRLITGRSARRDSNAGMGLDGLLRARFGTRMSHLPQI